MVKMERRGLLAWARAYADVAICYKEQSLLEGDSDQL